MVSHEKNTAVLKNLPETEFHTKDFITKISEKYTIKDFSISSLGVDEVLAKMYKDFEL